MGKGINIIKFEEHLMGLSADQLSSLAEEGVLFAKELPSECGNLTLIEILECITSEAESYSTVDKSEV